MLTAAALLTVSAAGCAKKEDANKDLLQSVKEKGVLTIKGRSLDGISRPEWEKEIPLGDALDLFPLCAGGDIDKTRYIVPCGEGRAFEVDEFHGENEGLVMAEIELGAPDEPFARPEWLGEEVTGDKRFYNSYLTKHPFKTW